MKAQLAQVKLKLLGLGKANHISFELWEIYCSYCGNKQPYISGSMGNEQIRTGMGVKIKDRVKMIEYL